jgi:hypothetical protein
LHESAEEQFMTWSFPSLQSDARCAPSRLRCLDGSENDAAGVPIAAADDLGPAFEDFARGDWTAAVRELRRLGERGVPEAARIASMMEARGRRLLGGSFIGFRTVEPSTPKPEAAPSAPARARVAVAGAALVVAGFASAVTILVERAEPPPTSANAAPPSAPAAPAFVRSVPEAADVLRDSNDAPQADLLTYGG